MPAGTVSAFAVFLRYFLITLCLFFCVAFLIDDVRYQEDLWYLFTLWE